MITLNIFIAIAVIVFAAWLITEFVKSAKTPAIRAEVEREFHAKEWEFEKTKAEKETEFAERERNLKGQAYRLQRADEREQEASEKIREVEELKHKLERQAYSLEQMKLSLLKENEEIIARRVAADTKGHQVGINKNWECIAREKRTLEANKEKCNNRSALLDEREKDMYKRAVLISDHLGIPLKCILNTKGKRLVGKVANELTEEHYALIDLVMSCPEDQLKDLLASMQQFQRNLRR